jgi:signal transduction histidine kinase
LSTAFGAVALALAAGLFVSLHQRKMLSAYVRAEALTGEQQRKLQTAQEELLHSQKMRALGTLAAGIAHDFNNLLSVIRLSNQLAAEQTRANGAAKENMDAIESAVDQGEVIVKSMLGYSRAAAESENEYSVTAAISETVAMLGRKFLSGIVLQLEVQPDLPAVCGVRGRLEQMLLNLVVNASEAMNGQGALRISARMMNESGECILKPAAAPRYVVISVGDSGPGIPSDILPRIFEPFFTTKSAGARPGTGLGLSTVYTMAQQDGLGLAVETTERAGTLFRILVPITEKKGGELTVASGAERNMPSARPVSGA